jgi:aconitate hydratase
MMNPRNPNSFGARRVMDTGNGKACYYRLDSLELAGAAKVSHLPYSLRILLESLLRQMDGFSITEADVMALANWDPKHPAAREIPFRPGRVILQDYTGVPCLADLAALRNAIRDRGGDPGQVQPRIPVDLVIDHSVQVDAYGSSDSLEINLAREMERNQERYRFLRWGEQAFQKFRIYPPGTGIIHQVNLEHLAHVVVRREEDGESVVFPDTLIGTDSHTPMINGLGVLGWGVGGIEAEACMLGEPVYLLTPEVVGVKLRGELPAGATTTDLVLHLTELLRNHGVVNKFVEFYGEGSRRLSLPDRATIANMAPEYGATIGFFPVDRETLAYLERTGRNPELVDLVERYCKEQGLFRQEDDLEPKYSECLELDLGRIEPSLAGPRRPHDRVCLADLKSSFQNQLAGVDADSAAGHGTASEAGNGPVPGIGGPAYLPKQLELESRANMPGMVAIAAITSCTNTSNPAVMIGAGLLAQKAVARGLQVPSHVKASLAPGSRAVSGYLKETGLLNYLEQLGFHIVAYGCATCIGNSGPLSAPVTEAIQSKNLVAVAVLSGNRNFDGRINPLVRASYLASPPLVVAFALAGTIAVDLTREPLGFDAAGNPVFLREIWPTAGEISALLPVANRPETYRNAYAGIRESSENWNRISRAEGLLYPWDENSLYLQKPPFFDLKIETPPGPIHNARILGIFGDSVTTDHISPAGSIPRESPAGNYLMEHGVSEADFNQYGSRRGNHQVMLRGTFTNPKLENLMLKTCTLDGVESGLTIHYPGGERLSIYEAAGIYRKEGVTLVIIAGKDYGTGSSRDWAAKGTALLGIRAVLAESFERIHRSNLVGMGILPFQFQSGENAGSLGLTGAEAVTVEMGHEGISPGQEVTVKFRMASGSEKLVPMKLRLDSPAEVEYYLHGGILPYVLDKLSVS